MQACRSGGDPSWHFPPEFSFCPATGARLKVDSAQMPVRAWVGPFGGPPAGDSANFGASGLRQTAFPLRLARGYDYSGHTESDATLPVPPPGDYEFFSGSFGTADAALVALDPRKGTMFAWLPASKKWLELDSGGRVLLSESALNRSEWRAELAVAFNSKLYLPTQQGLACVTPDVAALRYSAEYVGAGPVLAAPIWFDGKVWAPCRAAGGGIQFVNVDLANRAGAPMDVAGVAELGEASLPVSYGRIAVWPTAQGQLRLHKQTDGSVAAMFIPWPAGVVPQFQFGCPFLSRDGSLWQLCFDSATDSYLYVKLGDASAERVGASAPRLCSGSVNYRFAVKLKTEPWLEPELGDDASSNEVVIPLVESDASGSVIGLKIETSAALAHVLESDQRIRAELVLDDETTEVAFHTIAVSQPWRLRLFCHQGSLWAYHPMLHRIDGWALQT